MPEITRQSLRDYLDDALPDAELAAVEKAVRDDPAVQAMFAEVRQEVDRGEHSVGGVWRREHLSCPTRDQIAGYVLGAGDPDLHDYIAFHLTTVGCPRCQANHDDLAKQNAEPDEPVRTRHKRIVDSSAGVLKRQA